LLLPSDVRCRLLRTRRGVSRLVRAKSMAAAPASGHERLYTG
jgi:hypothetical protein